MGVNYGDSHILDTSNIFLGGSWYLSPFPSDLCASISLNWSLMPTSLAFSVNFEEAKDIASLVYPDGFLENFADWCPIVYKIVP